MVPVSSSGRGWRGGQRDDVEGWGVGRERRVGSVGREGRENGVWAESLAFELTQTPFLQPKRSGRSSGEKLMNFKAGMCRRDPARKQHSPDSPSQLSGWFRGDEGVLPCAKAAADAWQPSGGANTSLKWNWSSCW